MSEPIKEDQSQNGVRVIVTRSEGGSVVEADCQCFGMLWRLHSNPYCPLLIRSKRSWVQLPPVA
jgi:hypothetical protein